MAKTKREFTPEFKREAVVRYGYQRLHILLRREGWKVNHMA